MRHLSKPCWREHQKVFPVTLTHNPYGKKLDDYHIFLYRHLELDLMWQSEIQKLSQVAQGLLLSSPVLQSEASI